MYQVRLSVRLRKTWPLITTSRGPPRLRTCIEEILPRQFGVSGERVIQGKGQRRS